MYKFKKLEASLSFPVFSIVATNSRQTAAYQFFDETVKFVASVRWVDDDSSNNAQWEETPILGEKTLN